MGPLFHCQLRFSSISSTLIERRCLISGIAHIWVFISSFWTHHHFTKLLCCLHQDLNCSRCLTIFLSVFFFNSSVARYEKGSRESDLFYLFIFFTVLHNMKILIADSPVLGIVLKCSYCRDWIRGAPSTLPT